MPMYEGFQEPTHSSAQSTYDGERSSSRSASPQTVSGRSSPTSVFNPYYTGRPRTPQGAARIVSVNRQEIIRRIKSRDDRSRPTSPELERQSVSRDHADTEVKQETRETSQEELGLQIQRPRSALHKGDFADKGDGDSNAEQSSALSTSPPAPWHSGFPATAFVQAWREQRPQSAARNLLYTPPRPARSRAASSQFVYKAPTSPLVNSSRPDTPPLRLTRATPSPDKQSRRHTFSPQALQRFASDLGQVPAVPTLRKEHTYPYQAHQPRRSLHSLTLSSSPTSPSRQPFSSRRTSGSEAHSPLQHAPMVGSYEESILRGRMSTTPSKPLDFIAQIGVLGRGDCKPSLKCPPHIAIPFPAVFYSYGSGDRPPTITSDQPSPYVGLIDLEHSITQSSASARRDVVRRHQRLADRLQVTELGDASLSDADRPRRLRKIDKVKRRSTSPKSPPGGCYRIPQQGQLQIVIKNPNKTAVKLFLVPYDLSDMQPGQKTFIRQRSYSAGPIIDMPLSHRRNLGTDRPEASLSNSDDPNDRPVLRYLIHLHIACTGRGRFWLYKSIRVVFANRVPDGKEKLRNEIQLPDPRYSSYKPSRDVAVSSQANSPSYLTAARQEVPALPQLPAPRFMANSLPDHDFNSYSSRRLPPFQMPFQTSLLETVESRPSSRHDSDPMDIDSDRTRSEPGDPLSPTTTSERPMSPLSPIGSIRGLDEPFSFDRARNREQQLASSAGRGASLLSQRLRGLGM